MKKLVSVGLFLALLLSFNAVAMAEEDRPTISFWTLFTHVAGQDSYVEQYLEDYLGINIELNTTPSTESEAVNLMLASGEMPDCIQSTNTYQYMFEEHGLARSIPLDMVREYAPDLIEEMGKDPILYAMAAMPGEEEALYCLPDMYDTYSEMYPRAIFLNYDWIQHLGIDLGDVNVEQLTDQLYITDKGLTRDVFTEIVTKFVKEDPDGDGVDNTYGIIDEWERLMTSFGLVTTVMDDGEGNATMWYVHENCKDLLMYMNSLYNEGLLHPELFTLDWGMNWEMLKAGQAGIMLSGSTHYLNSWCTNRWPYAPLNGQSEAQSILMIPGILSDEGENVCPFYIGRGFNSGNGVFYVNADVDDEKLVNILKFYNALFIDDLELSATLLQGEEGVDWEWNEDQSAPVKLNTLPMGEKGTQIFAIGVQINERWKWATYEENFAKGVKYYIKSEGGIWNDDLVVDYKRDVFNETDAAAISSEYSADWTQIRNEYFQGVITGEKNIAEDWDAYIADLNAAHFDEYLEEMNQCPVIADVVAEYASIY